MGMHQEVYFEIVRGPEKKVRIKSLGGWGKGGFRGGVPAGM